MNPPGSGLPPGAGLPLCPLAGGSGECLLRPILRVGFARIMCHAVRDRLAREENFDPDFWVLSVETRGSELGLRVA